MQTPEWLKPTLRRRLRRGRACRRRVLLGRLGDRRHGPRDGSRPVESRRGRGAVPDRVDQSKRDPQLAERVAAIRTASSWNWGDLVMKNGWATMPGTTEAKARWPRIVPTRSAGTADAMRDGRARHRHAWLGRRRGAYGQGKGDRHARSLQDLHRPARPGNLHRRPGLPIRRSVAAGFALVEIALG